jgi:dihydrolipoamide dehydrogenase
MIDIKTKVLVVGGGPGGYVAAIRSGQLGLETTLVEADRLGGTCLIRGCIPSKALIHAADEFGTMARTFEGGRLGIKLQSPPQLDLGETMSWKDGIVDKLNAGVGSLLRKAKVRVVKGWAVFRDGKTCDVRAEDGTVTIAAEHVILATGSVPVEIPSLPFGGKIVSSEGLLASTGLPKSLVVVGAGYIGLELGTAFRKFGAKVTVIEQQRKILPLYDEAISAPVDKWLRANGVDLHLGASATGMADDGGAVMVESAEGQRSEIPADKVLVAVGRKPRVDRWGIENLVLNRHGPFIAVDEHCATSMKNVWAIGDLVGEPMLAHKASAQGEMVAEIIAGKRRRFAPIAIPAVCFTEPEVVAVGVGPADLDPQESIVASFPYAANGRALSMEAGEDHGFVRVVADKRSRRVLGVQAVGKSVSELAAAFTHAIEMQATLDDVAAIIHAHPTLGEAFHEVALKALGHAIHI